LWRYVQTTGQMLSPSASLLVVCYSGKGIGRNNPTMQAVHDIGPIPRGLYTMKEPEDTVEHGPAVIWLIPNPANEMFGRFGFGIHGDSIPHPGNASDGCIIEPRTDRLQMWDSGDHDLEVVA
jgi:hypothetical protein